MGQRAIAIIVTTFLAASCGHDDGTAATTTTGAAATTTVATTVVDGARDDEWAAFFKEHNFLIGISIDGPRAPRRRAPAARPEEAAAHRAGPSTPRTRSTTPGS